MAAGQATLVRRDDRSKGSVSLGNAARAAAGLLDAIQQVLFAASRSFREEHTYPVIGFAELTQGVRDGGMFLAAWSGTPESEQELGQRTGAAIRCIVGADPPARTCLITGRPATHTVLISRAY